MTLSIILLSSLASGKQDNTTTYLMAGRDMHWFPVFVSLLVSYLSAITLLGVPSEIYTYGLQYTVLCFTYFILIGVGAIIFLPIFYQLQVCMMSCYAVMQKVFIEIFLSPVSFSEKQAAKPSLLAVCYSSDSYIVPGPYNLTFMT